MARQRVHNRRAGNGTSNAGSSWISYSDMMAALVLVFVLFLAYNLFQYNTILQQKTDELEEQRGQLDELRISLNIKESELNEKNIILIQQQDELKANELKLQEAQTQLEQNIIILQANQEKLEEAQDKLSAREIELINLQSKLDSQELALRAANDLLTQQREAFEAQANRISSMVGVRSEIIAALSEALSSNNIRATVDSSGDIVLESTVFFESGKSNIKQEGRELLSQFLPVYLSVLLQPEYSEYLDMIIIEGHTDSTGTFENNMRLSTERALTVLQYCLSLPGLTSRQQELLQSKLSSQGRASSELIYNADGTENKDASRRVEFKFRLKDSEMVEEMRQILEMSSTTTDNDTTTHGE